MVIMTNNKQPDALRLIEELGMPHQDGFHEVLEETICELSWQHQRIAELEAKLAQPTEHTENALDMVWSVERMAYVHGNDLGASRGVGVVRYSSAHRLSLKAIALVCMRGIKTMCVGCCNRVISSQSLIREVCHEVAAIHGRYQEAVRE
jgi:hypothetical protein